MKQCLISILIVSRNRRKFLIEAIESIKAQTFRDYEIILVDDGSSEDISDLDVDIYKRIAPSGISSARNEAMKLARGKYFFVLDSDDTLEPECLEKLYKFIKEGYSLVACWLNICNSDMVKIGSYESKVQTARECLQDKRFPHPSTLFRRSNFKDVWYDESIQSAVDLDFYVKLALKNKKIGILPELLYNYRRHNEQEYQTERQRDSADKIRKKYENIC